MTKTFIFGAVMQKLVAIRTFLHGSDANKHPKRVLRFQLESALFITKAELLAAFGVEELSELPTKTLVQAVTILTRIETGKDSNGTIAEKAQTVIKAIYPRYTAELERIKLESAKRAMRLSLENRFRDLSGGKALPDGFETHVLADLVSDLRDGMVAETVHLMGVCGDKSLFHPAPERISDLNLAMLLERLKETMAAKQPVRMPMASKLREALAS